MYRYNRYNYLKISFTFYYDMNTIVIISFITEKNKALVKKLCAGRVRKSRVRHVDFFQLNTHPQ